MKKVGIGTSHAKLILVGEHAVVYGIPGITIPLTDIKVQATLTATSTTMAELPNIFFDSALYRGQLTIVPEELTNIKAMIETFIARQGTAVQWPADLQLTIVSALPFERGMGSSAAISTAVLRALLAFTAVTLTTAEFDDLVNISETIQHGNPSGMDALVVKSEQGYFFQRHEVPQPLQVNLPGYLLIVDSGLTGRTSAAVQSVATLKTVNAVLWQAQMAAIQTIVRQARVLLTNHDTVSQHHFGQLLDQNQTALQQLQVSTPQLNALVQRLRDKGALGAKLTGGGLGGCVFGYFADLTTAQQAQKQFSEKTWLTTLAKTEAAQ
ncbi:mevalonate kinase [Lapidilactobacillus bayanensis]|uniref:mevalonate kinase n=1 Tax=Lapidilactobacillus bayanensis TaxID=2485998 RepID=UPI000F7A78B2|nr:mevalonate kinase [Lapidilactobacillus bayanensis]